MLVSAGEVGVREVDVTELAGEQRVRPHQVHLARPDVARVEGDLAQAEEVLGHTVYENQPVWKSQVDKVLLKAVEAEREAYQRAREIAQKARSRRQYAEALSDWVRKVSPSISVPGDVTIASTVQGWEEDASRCERQVHEREQNERLQREASEDGAA